MKKGTIILFFALLIMSPAVSYGQLGRLIKNSASKVANSVTKATTKEANKEIDSAIQKKADKIVSNAADSIRANDQDDNIEEGEPSQGGGLNMGKLFANKVDLKYNENYSFTSRLYMQSTMYDKKDVTKVDMYMFYNQSSPVVGMETKTLTDEEGNTVPVTSSMVMDGENKCFIILTDVNGMKMGMISAVADENNVEAGKDGKPAPKSTPTNFVKTGNTKVIAGYKCDEYKYTAEDKSWGKVWFAKDADLKIDKRGWQNSGMAAYYGTSAFNDGIILATESYDEKGNLEAKSETIEINPNFKHSISIKGYSLRQMNMNQGQQKK